MTNHEYLIQALSDYLHDLDVGGDCFKWGICHYVRHHHTLFRPKGVTYCPMREVLRAKLEPFTNEFGYITPANGPNETRRAVCRVVIDKLKADAR